MTKPSVLVVHYSRSGTTLRLAELLAGALDADLETIVDRHARRGLCGWLRSAYEGRLGRATTIAPSTYDPSRYDVVVVGTPIWAGSLSSPVRAWLRRHRGRAARLAFFCTCGGDDGARAFAQMTAEAGLAPTATLVVRQAELDTSGARVTAFVTAIEYASAAQAGRSPAPTA